MTPSPPPIFVHGFGACIINQAAATQLFHRTFLGRRACTLLLYRAALLRYCGRLPQASQGEVLHFQRRACCAAASVQRRSPCRRPRVLHVSFFRSLSPETKDKFRRLQHRRHQCHQCPLPVQPAQAERFGTFRGGHPQRPWALSAPVRARRLVLRRPPAMRGSSTRLMEHARTGPSPRGTQSPHPASRAIQARTTAPSRRLSRPPSPRARSAPPRHGPSARPAPPRP